MVRLNQFSNFKKTITQITTADNSPTQGVAWSFTDLTKAPKDWFSDQDKQDIFTIKKEKAYWVNIKDFTSSVLSIDASSNMALSTTPHFENNVTVLGADKIGLVTNHINHQLTLKINGLNPLENTAYDVTAIIRGRKFPIMASGSIFNLWINNIQMGLEESIIGSTLDDAIKIVVYDGLGNFLTNTRFNVNFAKPAKPTVTFKDDGELIVDPHNYNYEIHNSPIIDTSPTASVLVKDKANVYDFDAISWDAQDGNVSLLRLVAIEDGVYSDMSIVPFVPFKKAHVLQVRNNGEVDKIPYSFLSKGILKKGNIEQDNGVQITKLRGGTIMMAYHPNVAEGIEQLNAFGGTTTMYLGLGGNSIAYITFY